MRRSLLAFWVSWACACGGGPETVDATVATIAAIRGGVRLASGPLSSLPGTSPEPTPAPTGPLARAIAGDRLETQEASRARLALDGGALLLVDASSQLRMDSEEAIELLSGRAYIETHAGDSVVLTVLGGTLRASDASLSVQSSGERASAYVVRGELSWRAGQQQGVARAGEEITIGGGEPSVTPARLWSDWTGGLARPGPDTRSVGPGMGVLEARVPDEIGMARWPLTIRRLDVQVEIEGDLAITEVEQEFFNPASETVEGLYRVSVPEGAVLQRFAVDRDGQMVEGYVREQQQARAAYQAQVYRGSTDDPALLEWDAPGSYRARIYPIAPGEARRISIRYAEWLTRAREGGPRLYRYPMSGGQRAPHVQELSFVADVDRAGAGRVRAGLGAIVENGAVVLRRSDLRPRADLWLELYDRDEPAQRAYRARHEPPPRAPDSRAIVHEADERDYWFLPLVLPERLAERARADGMDLVIIADVSAATDRSHLELGRSVVESITAHLGPNDRVSVVGADLRLRALGDGESAMALGPTEPARVEALLDALARMPAGGASDLGAMIAEAAELLDPARPGAVIYVGDAAPTVGELGAEALIEHFARLPHPVRVFGLAVGADANLDLLDALTRGGGLAIRVEERSEAADAALRVLARASRPMLSRVTVDAGSGIDNVFPRRPVDVISGDVLAVVGRVRDEPPSEVVVRGEVAGQPFEERLSVRTETQSERVDLRLRWASERLHQLLLEGAGREEVAELGTRYGLITPYTSYYVPSARELREMGAQSRLYLHERLLPDQGGADVAIAIANAALAPLALTACGRGTDGTPATGAATGPEGERVEAEESAPAADPAPMEPVAPPVTTTPAPGGGQAPANEAPAYDMPAPPAMAPPARSRRSSGSSTGGEGAIVPSDEEQRPQDALAGGAVTESAADSLAQAEGVGLGAGSLRDRAGGGRADSSSAAEERLRRQLGGLGYAGDVVAERAIRGNVALPAEADRESGDGDFDVNMALRMIRTRQAAIRGCYERELRNDPTLGGRMTIELTIQPSGAVTGARALADTIGPDVSQCVVRIFQAMRFGNPPVAGTVTYQFPFVFSAGDGPAPSPRSRAITLTTTVVEHARRRCSDAASRPLADRRSLWSERLERVSGVYEWLEVYRTAIRDCEARSVRDRRALLSLILGRAGNLATMVRVYQNLSEGSARGYVRSEILRRVRSPEDLRLVREAFGLTANVDWSLVEQVLARATTPLARLRALRQLVIESPDSFDLKLRLLEELQAQSRLPEALRLAAAMRADPLADAGVRTAIGEMYLRLDRVDDARRTFSEIVEFAPLDELARRRLGDLYRAHGWFEDAYRQYATLAEIRPDDPSVMLLLAQAAAGAGRTDEALRLEQRIMETAEPGSRDGLARIAQLWSSVRFAKLRNDARARGDEVTLAALLSRMRRSGVLREAPEVRVSLTWSHPDAQLALWAAHPGLSPTRPDDIAPEVGIEAFEVAEQEAGSYRIEVRRSSRDRLNRVEAELVVIWHEGRSDERIHVVPLSFGPDDATRAWTLTGSDLAEAPPSRGGSR